MYMKHLHYICFLSIVIVFFAFINCSTPVESFTPKIRELYRPILRKTRIASEGFYTKTRSDVSNIFRKFGIM